MATAYHVAGGHAIECRLILSSYDRMLGYSVPHCVDEHNES